MDAQQVAEAHHLVRQCGLSNHYQIKVTVSQSAEYILDGSVRSKLQPQPREAISRFGRSVRETAQRLREKALRIVNAGLRDGAKRHPLHGSSIHSKCCNPSQDFGP